ncbi:MAG: hypothetical protein V1703_02005 [Candidatus Altiarchaeota archaeon]
MKGTYKIILAGLILGLLWGLVLSLPSLLLASECRGRDFFGIIYENFVSRVIERPALGLVSLSTAPALFSMAIVCSIPFGGNSSLVYLSSIILTTIFAILFGVVGSLLLVGFRNFLK